MKYVMKSKTGKVEFSIEKIGGGWLWLEIRGIDGRNGEWYGGIRDSISPVALRGLIKKLNKLVEVKDE